LFKQKNKMDTNNNWKILDDGQVGVLNESALRTFMAGVFKWMSIALGISALTAYYAGHSPAFFSYMFNMETGKLSGLGYLVTFSPLIFVIGLQAAFNRLSQSALTSLFMLFSVIMGLSLGFIFLVYTEASITSVFITTALMFGGMSVVGYTTKTDLTKFGTFLYMGMWGIVITSVINFFVGSGTVSYLIGFAGVIIFTGMTAYDVQRLKNIGSSAEQGSEMTAKLSILGALHLYITFINLFLSLLRIMGSRK
jgi:FtsH-binding integral membrane protein